MILRIAAVVLFIIAAAVAHFSTAPDVFDVLAAISTGLACLALSPFEEGRRGRA